MRTRIVSLLLMAGCVVALPAPAAAQNQLFRDYRQDGRVNPCAYSRGELQRGLRELPPDVEQYVPGLADQLRRSCPGGAAPPVTQQQPTVAAPVGGGPAPPKPRTVVPRPPAPRVGAPKPVAGVAPDVDPGPAGVLPDWLAALFVALAAGGVALLVAVRSGALGDGRLAQGLRASLAEAGGRSADAVAQLWDRVRLGR